MWTTHLFIDIIITLAYKASWHIYIYICFNKYLIWKSAVTHYFKCLCFFFPICNLKYAYVVSYLSISMYVYVCIYAYMLMCMLIPQYCTPINCRYIYAIRWIIKVVLFFCILCQKVLTNQGTFVYLHFIESLSYEWILSFENSFSVSTKLDDLVLIFLCVDIWHYTDGTGRYYAE